MNRASGLPAPTSRAPGPSARRVVVLDTSPLSRLTERPGKSQEVIDCHTWFEGLQRAGFPVCLPEIADYELRRELLRAGQRASITRLDELQQRTTLLADHHQCDEARRRFLGDRSKPGAPDRSG